MGVVYQVCPFQALGPLTPIGEGLSPHVPGGAGWYSFLMELATALLLLSVSASAAEPAFRGPAGRDRAQRLRPSMSSWRPALQPRS